MLFSRLLQLAVLLWLGALTPNAHAADMTGQIRGAVFDDAGLPIPGAEVRIQSPDLLGDRVDTSDGMTGSFRFPQLPVGVYSLEVMKPGFSTWRTEGLKVSIGGSLSVEVIMQLAQGGEDVLIVDRPPVVDVEKTQTGVNISADQLKDLPTAGRDYQSAMAIAPGVVGSGNANMRGGFSNSNQFYVDGVNTTDPITNTFSLNMNYDAIDELQVITGGMDAEYGRALGGAVNIVTKSGGNDFEATLSGFYSDENFEVYEPRNEAEAHAKETSNYSSQQYALNVGGPILKDRIWFFTSYQFDLYRDSIFLAEDVERPTGSDPISGDDMSLVAPRDWRSQYIFGKITAQPNAEHRVWVHAQADPTNIQNVIQSPYTLPSAEAVQDQGGWLGSLGHLWMPSADLNLESQLYFQKSYIDFYPVLWNDCQNRDAIGACTDDFGDAWFAADPGGFDLGEYAYASFNERTRASANTALTWYPNFIGNHEVKLGLQFETLSSYYIYPGIDDPGLVYYGHSGDPTDLSTDNYTPSFKYVYDNDLEVDLTGNMTSAYLQDVWQPSFIPNLTLRPGVRMDRSVLNDDQGQAAYESTSFSPRFGFALASPDQRSSFHAFYGRFIDPGFLAISDLLKSKSEGYALYQWDEEAGDWATDPTYRVAGTFLKSDDLKNPYSDEFDIGYTRAVTENVAVDVTWAYKEARNFWEDDEVNLIWDSQGANVIGYRNGESVAIYRLRTPDDLYTRYNSLEFTGTGNFDKWWFIGSYTWAKATGTSDAQVYTYTLDTPEQMQYYDGYLSYDRTHAIKFNGTYRDTQAWSVGRGHMGYLYGWNFRMYSGFPYQKVYYNNYYGDWSNYQSVNNGDYRTGAFSQTDLRVGMTTEAGQTTWALTLDCINAFSDRAVTSVDNTWGNAEGDGVYTDENGEPVFGMPLTYQEPRRFQIGLRGEF